ncbi:portal protein [Mycobacterium phage 39HC]|uniref:portal protein n=1 Tax=Mycobacterium phage 39HC TaxID=1463809 RepID=UPI0003F1FB7B|nr:portal protein [Mycobacterium phage 39HC]AHJ88307.1 hypothetical protein 39HC_07 [Mycobacterium phage 39HC]AHJ88407.1 hypothetical protein 40BC_07 [Mycobacterium phage 40BC]
MAASPMRVVRRPKGRAPRRALTAASQVVTDPQKSMRSSLGGGPRADWQVEAWNMVDEVGELAYWLSWLTASCSRVQFIASEIDPDTGLPTGGLTQTDDGALPAEQARVAKIIKDIAGGPLGQAQLRKRSAECLSVPGEHWIVLLMTGKTDGQGNLLHEWFVLTRDEWKTTGNGTTIELPDGRKHDFIQGLDVMFRVWNPRPRRAKEATSPVRAVLDPCREIIRTTKKIKNASQSRLIGNGVVFLPAEMSLPASQAPIPEGLADIPGVEMPTVQGVPAAEELRDQLYQTASVAVDDENSQAALIPLLATVPGEHLGKILHLKFGNEITEVEIKTRNDAIARLAMGLNVSPERLLGVGSNSNHWSAWQMADEDVQTHIKPVIETLCGAINESVLRAVFLAEGIDPDKYMLWYDASGLTADPDLSDEAEKAKDQGALRNEVYLRALGLPDDAGYDLTTMDGIQLWVTEALAKDPTLISQPVFQALLSAGNTDLANFEWPAPPVAELPPGEGDEDEDEDDGSTEGGEPDTEDTASVTASSRADLVLAERFLTNRVLEVTNKRRVRGNEQKARLARVPARDWHKYLPPLPQAELPKAIREVDAALADEVVASLGINTEGLRAAVIAKITTELTRPMIDQQEAS